MLLEIHPKLPMRNVKITRDFYLNQLGFHTLGDPNFEPYLMVRRDLVEIHFFAYKNLNPFENYGQVYIRTNNIDQLYQSLQERGVAIHPNGALAKKPWGIREFSILDPDHNLLTFGQKMD